jgi:class 3 adenylate cyclase/tetratricopeptide (TPR) repeat protein
MTTKLPDRILTIEERLQQGLIFEAYDLSRTAVAEFPENIRLQQLAGLCLAKLGRTESARTALETLYQAGHQDTETAGILGRVYKDLLKLEGNPAHAERSRTIYLQSFLRTGDIYPGINAATLSLVMGEKNRARELAAEVIRRLPEEPKTYWSAATCGEASLIIGDTDGALSAYREARRLAGRNRGDLASSYEQLRFIEPFIDIPLAIFQAMQPPSVVVFSGHMIDRPDRVPDRLPDNITDRIKTAISEKLLTLDAGIGFSSAACGADILFIEAMLEKKGEVSVFLPFAIDDFIKTSIEFAGEHWIRRFEAIRQQVTFKFITEECFYGDDGLFQHMNTAMMGLAILTARLSHSEPYFLAVLDQDDASIRKGGTGDMVNLWPFKDRFHLIDPSDYRSDSPRPSPPSDRSTQPGPTRAIPYGIRRSLKSILFADIVGFSQLAEEQTPYFVYEVLNAVASKIRHLTVQPDIVNTWGDAIFVVYDYPEDLMDFALMLNNAVRKTDWGRYHLPTGIDIRIALHIGPVFIGTDPITGNPNAYGTHITRTARMEPVSLPGCIYASEQFAALLLARTGNQYQYRYVGRLALPKHFGVQEIYQITRPDTVG